MINSNFALEIQRAPVADLQTLKEAVDTRLRDSLFSALRKMLAAPAQVEVEPDVDDPDAVVIYVGTQSVRFDTNFFCESSANEAPREYQLAREIFGAGPDDLMHAKSTEFHDTLVALGAVDGFRNWAFGKEFTITPEGAKLGEAGPALG